MKTQDSDESDAGEAEGSEMEDGGSSDENEGNEEENTVPMSKQKYGAYADTESEDEGDSDEAEEMAQDAESEDESAAVAAKEKKVNLSALLLLTEITSAATSRRIQLMGSLANGRTCWAQPALMVISLRVIALKRAFFCLSRTEASVLRQGRDSRRAQLPGHEPFAAAFTCNHCGRIQPPDDRAGTDHTRCPDGQRHLRLRQHRLRCVEGSHEADAWMHPVSVGVRNNCLTHYMHLLWPDTRICCPCTEVHKHKYCLE